MMPFRAEVFHAGVSNAFGIAGNYYKKMPEKVIFPGHLFAAMESIICDDGFLGTLGLEDAMFWAPVRLPE